jgi:GNAT superfamily N-acetyltransferase
MASATRLQTIPGGSGQPPAFAVRRATERDHDAVESLYRKCRRDALWLAPAKRSGTVFAQASVGETVFVAVGQKGEVEGLISVWEAEPFVHHLYVRAQSRRKGVAEALLKSLVGRLAFPWRLKCVRANTEALDFYAKRGWQEIGAGEGSEGAYVELQLAQWAG